MPSRPNFIKAATDGDAITLRGESDPEPPGDIVHIHVVLTQGEQTAAGEAAPLGAEWQARVPAGKVYTARDIAEDPHYRARDMILRQATRDGDEIDVPGIVPKLLGTPGAVRSSAPHLGDDTDAVLQELGLSPQDIAALRGKKVVA